MNLSEPDTENPTAPGDAAVPVQRRDAHGRTLDEAMAEDRARRQAEWEQRLQRAYRPLAICDVLLIWPPVVTVLLIGAGVAISGWTRNSGPFELGLRLAAVHLVVLVVYTFSRFTLLRWWMRERLDEVKAGARADGVTLPLDPLTESDRLWFKTGS